MEVDMKYKGNNILSEAGASNYKVNTAEECRDDCQEHTECIAWSFNTKNKVCLLKDDYGNKHSKPGSVSGLCKDDILMQNNTISLVHSTTISLACNTFHKTSVSTQASLSVSQSVAAMSVATCSIITSMDAKPAFVWVQDYQLCQVLDSVPGQLVSIASVI